MEAENATHAEDLQHRLGKVPSAVGSAAVHRAFTEKASSAVAVVASVDSLEASIDDILDANTALMQGIAS